MDQPVFADVEIARACRGHAIGGQALGDVVMKGIDAGEAALLPRLHFVVDAAFFLAQRPQLPTAIVNNADGRTEPQRDSPLANRERVLWIGHASTDYGIDVHVKLRMLG